MNARWLAVFGLGVVGGCHLLGGTADLYIDPALETSSSSSSAQGGSDSVASTTTTGGQGGMAQGGSGGAEILCIPKESIDTVTLCPQQDTDCRKCKLINDECIMDNLDTGTMCTENEGKFCDGGGECVGCLKNGDCPSMNCQDNVCYAASCDDTVANNNESDVDCGGPDCGACDNGKACFGGTDCESTLCDLSKCVGCDAVNQDDCATGQYCEKSSNHCTPTKSGGQACGDDYECQTGTCCEADFQDYCKGFILFSCL